MRWFLPAAAALSLGCVPADALVYWHGPGYYVVGCNGERCTILQGPFVEELDCRQKIAKDREYGPKAEFESFECRRFEKAPDERDYYNPWKGGEPATNPTPAPASPD